MFMPQDIRVQEKVIGVSIEAKTGDVLVEKKLDLYLGLGYVKLTMSTTILAQKHVARFTQHC